jgi:hypothetical protein
MKFTESTENDIEQLTEWIQNDPYHQDCLDPYWWLTGQGLLSFCIQDSNGPIMYVRLDRDGELLRFHTQFAPESEVSKLRVVKSIVRGLPKIELIARAYNLKGFIFKSTSLSLINFMKNKFGFIPVNSEDYQMLFED